MGRCVFHEVMGETVAGNYRRFVAGNSGRLWMADIGMAVAGNYVGL